MTAAGSPDPSVSPGDQDPSTPREKCTARSSRSGKRCGRWPRRGAKVCDSHGGAAPQVRKAAAREVARVEAVAALQLVGHRVDNPDPGALLLDELGWSAGSVRALRSRLTEMDAADLIEGDSRAWLDVYLELQQRLMRFADLGARLGLEQRRTLLAEQLGGLVSELIRTVLDAADLTSDQRATVARVLPERLRELVAQVDPSRRN